MNVAILTVGSRGDIQPSVALGAGLRAAALGDQLPSEDGVGTVVRLLGSLVKESFMGMT